MPSIEVLAEAAMSVERRGAVIHVLESSVVAWMKQVKVRLYSSHCKMISLTTYCTDGNAL